MACISKKMLTNERNVKFVLIVSLLINMLAVFYFYSSKSLHILDLSSKNHSSNRLELRNAFFSSSRINPSSAP